MALADGAVPVVAATGTVRGTGTPRSIRETSLYAASLGLFGVLTGLALITPLNAFAEDILNDPLGGDWSARFLAIGLLAETGFALHVLTAEMGGKTLVGGSIERDPSLPGVRWFEGYHAALSDMWSGAVLVIFLIILAAAIPRGVTVFLPVYISYLVWSGFVAVVYFLRNPTWARRSWRTATNPVSLIRLAESERHVPAYTDDLEAQNRGDVQSIELMIARGEWLVIWDCAVLAIWSGVLWAVAANSSGLAATVAAAWLISVFINIVLSYRLYPQAFAR